MSDTEFWLQRWQQGETGFHQTSVMPLLEKHWSHLQLPPGSAVLVPLAGKSLDVMWLAQQGHHVFAVELSPLAIEQFFHEHDLSPTVRHTPYGQLSQAGSIEFLCGNIFDLPASELQRFQGCYDRAALVALTAEQRQRYAQQMYAGLPAGCRGLLLSLDYPPHEMQGPPFAVSHEEVQRLFGADFHIQTLESRDILAQEAKFASRGVSRLFTRVYRLERRHGQPAQDPAPVQYT